MKTELKAKFINYLAQRKKGDEGFTLIELLVVIIIIGILSAIALPSFLNQANKAKQSEAKQYTGALIRAQQAFYLENSSFTSDFDALGKVVKAETTNYTYKMTPKDPNTTTESVRIDGESGKPALKSYAGKVQLDVVTTTSEVSNVAVLCESKAPGSAVMGSEPNPKADPKTAQAQRCGTAGVEVGLK